MPTPSMSIHAALLAARRKMDAPKKTARNPHTNSSYAPLDELVRVSFDPLAEQGLMLSQHTYAADGRMVLVTRILAADAALDCGTYDLGPLVGSQSMGSSISYARRYTMAAVLGLAAEDDDDGEESERPAAPPAVKREATPARAALEKSMLDAWKATQTPEQQHDPEGWKRRGSDIKALLKLPRYIKVSEMTDEQLRTCIAAWGGVPVEAAVAPNAGEMTEDTGQVFFATRADLVALVTAEAQKRGLNFNGMVAAMRSMSVAGMPDKASVLFADLSYDSMAELMMKWTGCGYTANTNAVTSTDADIQF